MSTHATISAVMDDNTVMMTRVNYNGYLDHTGRALLKYFNDFDSVSKLVNAGEAGTIDLDTGTVECYDQTIDLATGTVECYDQNKYYPRQLNSIFDWYKAMPEEEYNYIFVDGKWFLYSPAKLVPLQDEDEYDGTLVGEAQIVPKEILNDDKLMKKISIQQTKTLMGLTQKALEPIDGHCSHCSIDLYDLLRVRVTGNFNLDYYLDADILRYPFYNRVGLAYAIYDSVTKRYEKAAKKKQCAFKKEDVGTVAKVIYLWDKIIGFDRAKHVYFDEDYLHYFLDALGGVDTELSASKIQVHKKGYVLKKIDALIASMSDEDKDDILRVFKKSSSWLSWDTQISARPVFDYKNNLEKYGTGYKDMKEELEKDELYVKMRDLRDQAAFMCRESFVRQVSKLIKR